MRWIQSYHVGTGVATKCLRCLICLLCVALAAPVRGHKIVLFAWVEGDRVHVESKFSGGRKPVSAPITIYDLDGHKLLEGTTDSNGAFVFKAPAKIAMKIVLSAGMGHQAEWQVKAAEFEHSGASTTIRPSAPPAPDLPEVKTAPEVGAPLTASQIETLIENVMERKLRPIITMLVNQHDRGPRIADVLGGLGYIFGLVGLAAYMRYRKTEAKLKPESHDR